MEEKANILVVDDNVSLCKTMSFVLERKGCAVSIANDGPEAIARVKEEPFDMIFIDIKMPFMDGLETYKKIKKIKPEVVVTMMTAYAVEDKVQEALQEGAYGVLYKPLDLDKVVALIEGVGETRQGMFILLVDDDPEFCIALEKVLTHRDYNVGIAHTGEEANAMAQKKTYDIIFIDLNLPTINGLETYLAIREISPGATVIMMTAYRQEMADKVQTALRNNAYACLHKPFEMEEVFRLLAEILERKQEAG